jgi:hypothetical protein
MSVYYHTTFQQSTSVAITSQARAAILLVGIIDGKETKEHCCTVKSHPAGW